MADRREPPIEADGVAARLLIKRLHAAGLLERATNVGELELIFTEAFAGHRRVSLVLGAEDAP
jgi:hypothetical protein